MKVTTFLVVNRHKAMSATITRILKGMQIKAKWIVEKAEERPIY